MACVNKSNNDNFLVWQKVKGIQSLADLQANGMPNPCNNTKLLAPTNLTSNGLSPSEIKLDWTSNSAGDEDGFTIERSLDGIIYTEISTVLSDIVTYTDTGRSTGVEYFYRVAAISDINSAYSNITSLTLPLAVIFSTNWNDATASDGAFAMSIPNGGGTYKWFVDGGGTYSGINLNIPADTGDLDGTNKKITLWSSDDLLKGLMGFLSWGDKKIVDTVDLAGFEGSTFTSIDFRNGLFNVFLMPEMSLTGYIRFTACTDVSALDFSNVTINGGDNMSFSGMANLSSLIFKAGSIKTGDRFFCENTLLTTLDLSKFTTFDTTTFEFDDNALLATLVLPTVWSSASTFSITNTALTTLDLSGLSLLTTQPATISNNGSLTSMIFGATTWDGPAVSLNIQNNGALSGTLDMSLCEMTFSQFEFLNNSGLNSMLFHPNTKTDRFRAQNCDLGYFDMTTIMNDWDNVTSVNLTDNNMTASDVNHFLVDFDGQITAGTYVIAIAGTNAAPDGTSGGFDGTAAKASLILKGIIVVTS